MAKFYSEKTGAFYASEFREDYEAAGTWPDDATEVTEEAYLIAKQPRQVSDAERRDAILYAVRTVRETTLNRLTGIGFAAMLAGDADISEAVFTARNDLLAITDTPAEDADELRRAIEVEYDRIIAAAPADLRKAFVKLNLIEV